MLQPTDLRQYLLHQASLTQRNGTLGTTSRDMLSRCAVILGRYEVAVVEPDSFDINEDGDEDAEYCACRSRHAWLTRAVPSLS